MHFTKHFQTLQYEALDKGEALQLAEVFNDIKEHEVESALLETRTIADPVIETSPEGELVQAIYMLSQFLHSCIDDIARNGQRPLTYGALAHLINAVPVLSTDVSAEMLPDTKVMRESLVGAIPLLLTLAASKVNSESDVAASIDAVEEVLAELRPKNTAAESINKLNNLAPCDFVGYSASLDRALSRRETSGLVGPASGKIIPLVVEPVATLPSLPVAADSPEEQAVQPIAPEPVTNHQSTEIQPGGDSNESAATEQRQNLESAAPQDPHEQFGTFKFEALHLPPPGSFFELPVTASDGNLKLTNRQVPLDPLVILARALEKLQVLPPGIANAHDQQIGSAVSNLRAQATHDCKNNGALGREAKYLLAMLEKVDCSNLSSKVLLDVELRQELLVALRIASQGFTPLQGVLANGA